jgi:hypothetical protein
LSRSTRLETVGVHNLGSLACKPLTGSPSGRRTTPRSTTSATDLPQIVKDEFDVFLECGVLSHGFLRLRRGDCGHDKLVAFNCKCRGFARRAGPGASRRRRPTWSIM